MSWMTAWVPENYTDTSSGPEGKTLAGRRIMIPPARPEANPLLRSLKRRGAETLEFPALKTAPPADYGLMDRAIQRVKDFDYIIFSGSS